MANYGLTKNLPANALYNSQIAAVIFVCSIVFKLSSLPGVVSRSMGSDTLWLYLFMTLVELVCFSMIYLFMRSGGDGFLTAINSKGYKLTMAVAMLYLMLKGVFYFAYTVMYLTLELFMGIAPYVIVLVFLIPVVFLGIKGIRTIARTAEIFVFILFLAIMVNLVFLKTDLDWGRNMPINAMSPSDFFLNGLRYGQWIGDMLPLMFIKPQNKKLPYIGISVTVVAVLINVITAIGVAMYGNALPYVSNMLIRIAGFNQLSLEIGRMEWSSLFVVITMAIFSLSYFYWGASACCERAFGSKKPVLAAYPVILVIILYAVPSAQSVADFALTEIGYAMFGLAIALPLTSLFILASNRRSFKFKHDVIYHRQLNRSNYQAREDNEPVSENPQGEKTPRPAEA